MRFFGFLPGLSFFIRSADVLFLGRERGCFSVRSIFKPSFCVAELNFSLFILVAAN